MRNCHGCEAGPALLPTILILPFISLCRYHGVLVPNASDLRSRRVRIFRPARPPCRGAWRISHIPSLDWSYDRTDARRIAFFL